MRRIAALLVCFALPVSAIAETYGDDIHTFTLENGLQGVVIEDHRAPIVTHMVWYRVGAADDPTGQSGLAHFLEHLMFKATEKLDDGEFSQIVAENGGDDNAFTSYDYTAYFQNIAADRLDLVMSLEADRMVNLNPGAEDVLSERDVVREERRQVVENSPGGPFREQRRAALFLNHPYGRPVIGWDHEMAEFSEEKAINFYRDHYAPNNAILIVAGDTTLEEVRGLAEKHFGPISASDAIEPRQRPQEPPQRAARRITYKDSRVRQPYVIRSYIAPPREPGDQHDAAALTVMAELLGGTGITSVMGSQLQLEEDIAINAGAGYSGTGLDTQSISFYVVPKQGVSLETAESRMDALLAEFLETGPDPEALERVKAQLRADAVYARDSQYRRTREIGTALASGLSMEDVMAWPDLLQSVTAEDVVAAAKSVLDPKASVTGWLMQDEEVSQ